MVITGGILTRQPSGLADIDWSNPICRGLVFAYLPGTLVDSTRRTPGFATVGTTNTTVFGSSIRAPGTNRADGLNLGTSPILGSLSNSTVFVIADTNATTNSADGGTETDGVIATGGNALYCERASSGNDIYKLCVATPNSGSLSAEFTYRNDAGTLLQQRLVDLSINNGQRKAFTAVKNGTLHRVYSGLVSSTGTFGSGSTAFTNANVQRRIGSDVADVTASWNGGLYLVAGWNRSLSDSEIAALNNNPWQLFAPLNRPLFFDAGGGGVVTHDTSGVLTSQGSEIIGSAARLSTHVASGVLTGQGSAITGSAGRSSGVVTHDTSGVLTSQGSTLSGSAARFRAFATSGVLASQGSVIVGSANHVTIHAASGTLTGQGSVIVGSAARVPVLVTHATSGVLTGQGSGIVGVASGPYVPPTGTDSRFIRNFAA